MCYDKQTHVFNAASLRDYVEYWHNIGASNEVLDWINNGVYIPFVNEPCSFYVPNRAFTGTQCKFIRNELEGLCQSGAIREVYEPPFCISPINCVPKKGGKHRLIVDLREINRFCDTPKFRNEDINTVIDLVQPHDLLITLDIRMVITTFLLLLNISTFWEYLLKSVIMFGKFCPLV